MQRNKIKQRKKITVQGVIVVSELPAGLTDAVARSHKVVRWEHISNVNIPVISGSEIRLLNGLDCPDALKPLDIKRGRDSVPFAMRTALSWTVQGPINGVQATMSRNEPNALVSVASARAMKNRRLDEQVKKFWELDEHHAHLM